MTMGRLITPISKYDQAEIVMYYKLVLAGVLHMKAFLPDNTLGCYSHVVMRFRHNLLLTNDPDLATIYCGLW